MLDTLRKNSKSALIYVFFFIIIVVFVFSFGPGSSGCRSGSPGGLAPTFAARVNGETIPLIDFQLTYAQVYRQYQNNAGAAFTEEMARTIGLKEKVLDQMIDRELLSQAAEDQGIAVSDQELSETLVKAFTYDGKFSEETYRRVVENQLGMTTWQFEEQERKRLAAQKMADSIAGSAKVSEDEVRAEFVREKERVDLGFVRFAPAAFKAEVPAPDEKAVEAFVAAHQARLEEAYKQNSYRYHKPKRLKARQILLKVDEKATAEQAEEVKKKLVAVKEKIAGGADFAAEARAVSEDADTRNKGGEMVPFAAGTMEPAFEKAAFALEEGEVSEPVRTRYGWHLVKVEQVLKEESRTLDEVKKELATELLIDDGAKEIARKKAEETLAQLEAGKSLEELWPPEAKKADDDPRPVIQLGAIKPAADSTGPFSPANDYIPKIGVDTALSRAVLALDEKSPVADKPFEVNNAFFVVVLKSHERPDLKELEAKVDEYREKARQRKSGEVYDAFVKGLKEKAKIEKNQALLAGSGRPGFDVADDG